MPVESKLTDTALHRPATAHPVPRIPLGSNSWRVPLPIEQKTIYSPVRGGCMRWRVGLPRNAKPHRHRPSGRHLLAIWRLKPKLPSSARGLLQLSRRTCASLRERIVERRPTALALILRFVIHEPGPGVTNSLAPVFCVCCDCSPCFSAWSVPGDFSAPSRLSFPADTVTPSATIEARHGCRSDVQQGNLLQLCLAG